MRLVIDVEDGDEQLRGWLRGPADDARRFESWLDLLAAMAPYLDRNAPGEIEGADGDR